MKDKSDKEIWKELEEMYPINLWITDSSRPDKDAYSMKKGLQKWVNKYFIRKPHNK